MNTIFPFQPMIITKVNAHSLSRPVDAIENKQKSTACLVLTGCQQAPIFDQPVKRKSQLLSGPILGGAYRVSTTTQLFLPLPSTFTN
ncbi:MAG: hypothetical protein ACMVP2_15090 [Imperialibacter sp.]|uniref:hypothetical protein n=1 Tax=Imperialibacter sp. TaxID=2038411 RepID=UPI003A85DEBE